MYVITLYILIPVACAALSKLSQKNKIIFTIILTVEYCIFFACLLAIYKVSDYFLNNQYTSAQITSGFAQMILLIYGISWLFFRKGKKDRFMPFILFIVGHFISDHYIAINVNSIKYFSIAGSIYLLISYFVILIRKIREKPALSVKDNKEINTENDKKTNEETDKKITIKTLKTTKRSSPKSKKTQKSPKKSLPK